MNMTEWFFDQLKGIWNKILKNNMCIQTKEFPIFQSAFEYHKKTKKNIYIYIYLYLKLNI